MFLLKDFKIFKEFLKIYWIKFMEYKLNFVLQMFWTSVGTVVMYFIWKYIIAFGVFKIYSLNEITLYYFFILIFNTGIQWGRNIRYDIIYGDIVLTITKPFTLAKYFIFNLFSMTITNIIGYILTIFIGIYLIGFKSLFAILAVFLGMGINFLIISIVITLAFWTGKTEGIFNILGNIADLLNGRLFPLDLFPMFWQNIFTFLPFQYVVYIPAKIFVGKIQFTFWIFLQYVFWIVILYLILKIIIYFGLKRYEQLGG